VKDIQQLYAHDPKASQPASQITRTRYGRNINLPARYAYFTNGDHFSEGEAEKTLFAFFNDVGEHLLDQDDPGIQQIGRQAYLTSAQKSSRSRKRKKEYGEDCPSYKMTLEGKWKRQWKESRDEELERFVQMDTWTLHLKKELPAGTKILKNTWAFLIKRLPDGSIRKFKSRLAVRGDMQEEGVHYQDTYSPTTSWTTVRL